MYKVHLTTFLTTDRPDTHGNMVQENFLKIMADSHKEFKSAYIKFYHNDEEVACLRKEYVVAIVAEDQPEDEG